MRRKKPTELQLRIIARYVRQLGRYMVKPGDDLIDDKIDALVKEKERAKRFVYEHTLGLKFTARRQILGLMQEHAKKKHTVPKKQAKKKDQAVPTWSAEQRRNLDQWRQMGVAYQSL